jgi:methyltransferase (TIGR00027 family)
VLVDAPPPIVDDTIGLQLVAPDDGWRARPDMDVAGTRFFRASIVARARFVDDLLATAIEQGVRQYVVLGAGLDSFAQRHPARAAALTIFEVDRPGTQRWKQRRLVEIGLPPPPQLRFVPVDFEKGEGWWTEIQRAGFDAQKPAIVAALGVSMYLTNDAIRGMLAQASQLAAGSTFAMTFLVPFEAASDDVKAGMRTSAEGARQNRTPFVSFFEPPVVIALARDAGFPQAAHVSSRTLNARYFKDRTDGLQLAGAAEEFLVATT